MVIGEADTKWQTVENFSRACGAITSGRGLYESRKVRGEPTQHDNLVTYPEK